MAWPKGRPRKIRPIPQGEAIIVAPDLSSPKAVRAAAAAELGVSIKTIEKLEQRRAIVTDSGGRVTARMTETTVSKAPTIAEYDSSVGVEAFRLLADGATPADLVTRLGLHPRQARAVVDDWCELSGGMYIDGRTLMLVIAELPPPPDGAEYLPSDARALLARVASARTKALCSKCHARAVFCASCAHTAKVSELERAARAAEEATAAREHEQRMAEMRREMARKNKRDTSIIFQPDVPRVDKIPPSLSPLD